MTKPLRDYQRDMIAKARASLAAGNLKVIVQAPTGSGKTRIAAEIIRLAMVKGRKVLFIAPRRELIYQAREAFAAEGVWCGTIMAGEVMTQTADVQVASFDTLHARGMLRKRIAMPEAQLVLVDEVHLALAPTRRAILDHYHAAGSTLVGLTATPARGDGRGLGEAWDDLVEGPSVALLTEQGHLVPARYYAPTKPDLEAVGLNADGDYIEDQLGEAMDKPPLIGDIVENWQRIASDRRTVVFCVNRAHSRHVRDAFLAAGVEAEHVDGETPEGERADIFERVRRGATQVLCNVFVASYGLDIPVLDCAVLARPTKNIALYLQTVGRVLRIYPGKTDAMVIDHAGAVLENGFADDYIPWSLDAKSKVKDRKAASQNAKSEPKKLECGHCHTVFSGRRDCPSCGHSVVPKTEAIPVHQADLQEISRDQRKANRELTWEEKAVFIGELRAYAARTGKADGWIAHKYRARVGVWPNDARVKHAPACIPSPETLSWIKSQNIRYAKRREAVA
jgi:DNA repair protein RadD